jgi:hypothetical protein
MMTPKQQAIDILRKLPDDCTMQQIQDALFVAQLRQRLETADNLPSIPHEEVKKRLQKWITK